MPAKPIFKAIRATLFACAWGAVSFAQQPLPVGITHGTLMASRGSASAGDLTIQSTDGSVYACAYDSHTLFQRNRWPIHADALSTGDPLEVVSDHRGPSQTCYTRMVSVVPPARPVDPRRVARTGGAGLTDAGARDLADREIAAAAATIRDLTAREGNISRADRRTMDYFIQRGAMSFAGLVVKADATSLTLKTRSGLQRLLLRSDTRYSDSGLRVDLAILDLLNRHVFIKAGHTPNGGVEAYQVMWGEILQAR
jgi:hypothetical protein